MSSAFELLKRVTRAASAYTADQSDAEDSRCGLVQPVTVEEAEELNEAVKEAWGFILDSEVRKLRGDE